MAAPREIVELRREVEGTVIPAGYKVTLPAGSRVQIRQALGGTFTVASERAGMVRIEGKDADALGADPPPPAEPGSAPKEGATLEEMVLDQLKTVFDPEIPVNIVDLGLIYQCFLKEQEGGARVDIKMTTTAPGCGMGQVLKMDAEQKILSLPGVKEVHIEMVLSPPWDPSMMSEAARLELGM